MAELELEKERGNLLPVKYVERQWGNLVLNCKSKLLSIPSKLAPVLANETDINISKNIIEQSINEALIELAKANDIENIDTDNQSVEQPKPKRDENVPTARSSNDKPVRKQV